MQFRRGNRLADVHECASRTAGLVGYKDYKNLLDQAIAQIEMKGYIAPFERTTHDLLAKMKMIEDKRRSGHLNLKMIERCHQAVDLLLGIGQTVPHLSSEGKARLKQEISAGIRENTIYSLHHEFRAAEFLSKCGWDISLTDIETAAAATQRKRPDITARRGSEVFELEAKCVSAYSGLAVHPVYQDQLWDRIRRGFTAWADETTVPVVNVEFPKKFSREAGYQEALLDAINSVCLLANKDHVEYVGTTKVCYLGDIPFSSAREIKAASEKDADTNGVSVIMRYAHPRVIIRLVPQETLDLLRPIKRAISSASKQLSGSLPGVIWCHMEYTSVENFDLLAKSGGTKSYFNQVKDAVFSSPNKVHVCQLVFSGGSHLSRGKLDDQAVVRSTYRRLVFNAPRSKFNNFFPLPA